MGIGSDSDSDDSDNEVAIKKEEEDADEDDAIQTNIEEMDKFRLPGEEELLKESK
jgi:hypothetical protein